LSKTKPFYISKQSVMTAWKKVKANKGSHGIDGESIQAFEANLKDNLYKLWNRMSSGTYFPPPVREVEIPKSDGRMRKLGIPTVMDRVGQAVVKDFLESQVEPKFHKDSQSKKARLLWLSPLRTVRDTFASYGSSLSKAAFLGSPAIATHSAS
jgi:RNA-directed DNA polymerase